MRSLLLAAAAAVAALVGGAAALPYQPGYYTPASSLAYFQNLTDAQMEPIFLDYGVPNMPGTEPGFQQPAGKAWYDFCVGRTFINAGTTAASNFISGVWPQGTAHPINNLFMRGWWGKVFYNDGSNKDVVQVWNLLYSNGTVGFDAIAFLNDTTRITNDGKQSLLIDYALTDFVPFRSIIDELRLVNTEKNIYLGRIWSSNPVDSLQKLGYKGGKVGEALYRGKLAALNSTWLDFVGWSGLASVAASSGLATDYFQLGFFGIQCLGPVAPKLKYAWTQYVIALTNILTGFYRPEGALPGIPYAPSKTPTRVGPGFPTPSWGVGTYPRLHVWPFKVSDVGQVGHNVSKIPAFKGEPVLGNAKLYPIVVQGVNNWFNEGKPDPSWTPTDVELKAADIAKWVNGPFSKLTIKHLQINGTVGNLTLPADHVNPSWNAAMAAIHAVEAANAAAKRALEDPTDPVNKLGKLLKTAEYTGKVIVNFPDGYLGSTVRGVLADKPPVYNLTGFFDYIDKLKHLPLAHLPKLNYTPPEIVWDGDLKAALANKTSPWNIKVGGKNLTAWKHDLKAVLTKDEDVDFQARLDRVNGHARGSGRKLI